MKLGQRFKPYRLFTGIFIPDAVYRNPNITAAGKLLYGRLAKYEGERGEAYPAVTTLAMEIGISERQVFEHLSGLVEEGLIEREPRPGTSTVYHFLWHPSFEPDFEVVRKTALPDKSEWCGNHHGGSAENRTTGSAENRTLRESIEESHGSESNLLKVPASKTLKPTPLVETEFDPTIDSDSRDASNPGCARPRRVSNFTRPKDPAKEARKEFAKQQREALKGMASNEAQDTRGSFSGIEAGTGTQEPPTEAPAPDFPAIWNRLVPACPVNWSKRRDRMPPEQSTDPDFVSGFEKICGIVQKIHLARGSDAGWLTFFWLFKYKAGTSGWWKLLRGEFDWMLSGSGKGGAPKVDALAIAEEMRRELEAKRASQAGTKHKES